jgi:hypothetical protein
MSAKIDGQKPAPSATNVIVGVTGPLAAARLVESDPAFAEAAAVSEWSDAQAVDLLSRR